MALIRINARGQTAELHGSPAPLESLLQRATAGDGPVIVMIHGYNYRPGGRSNCPHRHLLSLEPAHLPWRAPSWPRQLGFGLGHADEGLGIAFGWNACGTLRQAQASAARAGQALAQVCALLHRQDPRRPVHVIGHSLGIEVALEMLHHLPQGAIGRIISLFGASFQSRTATALDTPAGRSAEFINITSRENDPFDFLFERLTRLPTRGDHAIGHGLNAANAVTLPLDDADTLSHLRTLGYAIAQPQHRICHWSSFTRPGTLRFTATCCANHRRRPCNACARPARRARHAAGHGCLRCAPSPPPCPPGTSCDPLGARQRAGAPRCSQPFNSTTGPPPTAGRSPSRWRKWACPMTPR
ncbi:DUF726 domain-containing protein [Leisingera sp. XS_AS12]|uniref:DUF726 domain-containing protein n=1 Tax=Leisingera sp. XS_AS12 TaxID=3241294 RepID=UPI0035158D3C